MKSAITAIYLFIPFVIPFVVIGCKDFSSNDEAMIQEKAVTEEQTTLTTLKPVEKPVQTKSVVNEEIVEETSTGMKEIETNPGKKPEYRSSERRFRYRKNDILRGDYGFLRSFFQNRPQDSKLR